jgi:hypothetical protein
MAAGSKHVIGQRPKESGMFRTETGATSGTIGASKEYLWTWTIDQ